MDNGYKTALDMLRYPVILTAIGCLMFLIGREGISEFTIQVLTKGMISIVAIGWLLWLGVAIVEIKERLGGR